MDYRRDFWQDGAFRTGAADRLAGTSFGMEHARECVRARSSAPLKQGRRGGRSIPRRHVPEPLHLFAMRIHDALHLFAAQRLTPLVGAPLEKEPRFLVHGLDKAVLLLE